MSTPVSSLTPYCTVQQFLTAYDSRVIGDLIADNNAKVPSTQVSGASDGATLPAGTIHVLNTAGFLTADTIPIISTTGTALFSYTGLTATSFTGCTGGTGTINRYNPVTLILTDPTVATALSVASGYIEAACLAAGRYQAADLNILNGQSLLLLQRLTCDLAFWELTTRRKPNAELTAKAEGAMVMLERLRKNEAIFSIAENQNAAVINTTNTNLAQFNFLDLASQQSSRFFGQRAKYARLFNNQGQ